MEISKDANTEVSEYVASLEALISEFLETQSIRYEAQAIELLSTGFLNIRLGEVSIKYKISGNQFCYEYRNRVDGSRQESEILAPEEREDQIVALKFIFAQSEASASL